jgi:hypothetical protein
MSFIYSRAAVEAFSPGSCTETPQSAPSKSSQQHRPSLWHDKTMDASRLSRFGMTSEPLTETHGEALLRSCLAGFRARTSPVPEMAQESTATTPASGTKWRASFAKYDREKSAWKTPQCSLDGDLDEFSGTWPRWGLMRDGECWEAGTLEPPLSGYAYGSLPAPSGTSNHGKNHVCGRLDEWGGSSNPWRGTEIGKVSCPAFEEWVMGWPVQWTEPTASAMDRFRHWLQQHGAC